MSVRHDVASRHEANPVVLLQALLEFAIATLGLVCFMGVAFVGLCVDVFRGPK